MCTRFVAFLSDALENPGSSAPGPHCWGCYQKGHGGRASSVARTSLMSPRTSSCRVFWVLPLLYSSESPAIHREDSSGSHLCEKVCYSFISGRFSHRKNVCAAPHPKQLHPWGMRILTALQLKKSGLLARSHCGSLTRHCTRISFL